MRYEAVIFDLDGTLLNTIEDIADSFNAVLRKRGYNTFTVQDYKYFVGKGVNVLIQRAMKEDEIQADLFAQIKKEYYEEYGAKSAVKTKPYEGIMKFLNDLEGNSVRINVLSNKPHSQTLTVMNNYFKNINFDNVYGKKEEFPIKPNPESAFDIIEKLAINKEKILYVGDTLTDMLTAKNAGLDSVGVLWGFRNRKELEEHDAKYIVSRPEEILKIVIGDNGDIG